MGSQVLFRYTLKLRDIFLNIPTSVPNCCSVTHVITRVDGRRESMSEKVMAGLAAGRWILTRRYLEKSIKVWRKVAL